MDMRSLVAPIVVWDDENFSRAPHSVAAAAIAYYVEAKRKCKLVGGCEHVRRLGIAYWPFLISRRRDERLVVVDLLALHSFRVRLLRMHRIAETIAFASAASDVGAGHAGDFVRKLREMLSESVEGRTEVFPGVPGETDHIEQLVLIARDGKPSEDCAIEARLGIGDAEDILAKLDVLCDNLLEEYKMLERLYDTIVSAVERMGETIEEEVRKVIGEYGRAVRAIQARINARMAGVRSEIEQRVGEVWEKYSRRLSELSARLDDARRRGSEEEAAEIERMISRVKREYERETESIEKRYESMVRGEVAEIESLEREKEAKIARLRSEMDRLRREADQLLSRLSRLLDQLVEIRSQVCSAGTLSPYVVESNKAMLYVPVIAAELAPHRRIMVPILAVAPAPGEPEPIRPLVSARRLVQLLERAGIPVWERAFLEGCRLEGGGFRRLVRDGVEELVRRRVLPAEDAARLLENVERYWLI